MLLFSSCHVHVSLMLTRFCLHKKQVIFGRRSEEHTSELQSQSNLVCRLLLEKNNAARSSRSSPPSCSANRPGNIATAPSPPAASSLPVCCTFTLSNAYMRRRLPLVPAPPPLP